MNITRASRGFTLTETLVVVAVSAILGAAITGIWIGYNNFFALEQTTVVVATSASRVVSVAEAAMLQASSVESSHTFTNSGTTLTSGTSTLVLKLPTVNSSGNVVSNSYDYIAIYASNTNAYEQIDAAAGSARVSGTTILSTALSALTFTYYANPITAATSTFIDVQTSTSLVSGTASSHLHETLYLRNN